MDFFEVVKGRRSVRKYRDEKVDEKTLEEMVEAAKYAASARSEYPWHFITITDRERVEELTNLIGPNGAFMKDAAAAVVIICKDTKYYIEDGSAAAQNLINAAYAKGVGTCWIAGDKKDYCPDVLKFVEAPEGYKLICVISCGIPAEEPVKKKPETTEIMSREKYGKT